LIVDDELFNREALTIILNSIGIDAPSVCDYAKNGQEALDMIISNSQKHPNENIDYDLILMDCNMPLMDGYEATTKIREYLYSLGVEQPIISAVTGHTEDIYTNKAIQSGMN